MLARLGSALILIGMIVMVVFLVSFSAGRAEFEVLAAGAAASTLGLLLRRRGRSRGPEAGRFRTLRRLLGSDPDPTSGEDEL